MSGRPDFLGAECGICRTHVGVGRASHTNYAGQAAHCRSNDECDTACLLDETCEDCGDDDDDWNNDLVLGAHECFGATAYDAGDFDHFFRTFVHGT